MITLPPGQIHLWFAFLNEINDPHILAAYEELLTPEENEKRKRFHFKKHQHQYLVTRALVKTTLSFYNDVDPRQWRFSTNKYGRPEIISTPGIIPIRFNLSHADGLVMCGVTRKEDIGVDVENLVINKDILGIAEYSFSTQEVVDLKKFPKEKQHNRFFDYWTLKESFIKARGMGLSLPLNQFSFSLLDDGPLTISFQHQQTFDPKSWQFWRLKPSQQHAAAVAIKREEQVDYQLSIKKIVPLVGEQSFSCPIVDKSIPLEFSNR